MTSQGHSTAGVEAVGQHTSELHFLIPPDNTFTYLQLRRDDEAALGNIQPHSHSLALHLHLRNEPRHRICREP
jgi:hypothetical protein